MKNKKFIKRIGVCLFLLSLLIIPAFTQAEEAVETAYEANEGGNSVEMVEITEKEAGVTEEEAANVDEEEFATVTESGTLIEIGNTTAEETTIIIRTEEDGETVDKTIQIDSDTDIVTDNFEDSDLSDWIAGDQITFTVEMGNNSGELKAKRLRNRSFRAIHRGKNGWVKEIRPDLNEMDVEWAGNVYTLNVSDARMVAGLVNPASISDFQVGDRIRARVVDDGDGDSNTWDAKIIVVLRRGDVLFMRVTRWVVPAEIVSIPEDTSTFPYTIVVKVLKSKFYEEGDVNNLIGEPGTEVTIQINEKTKLVRRYLGLANIGEFIEGDYIRIVGRLNDETGYIDANLIKNNSIQRLGVSNRVSEVVSVDFDSKNLIARPIGIKNPLTGKRHKINGLNWTVQTDEDTKIKKNGEDIDFSELIEGDIIRVRGVANRRTQVIDVDAISVVTNRFQSYIE